MEPRVASLLPGNGRCVDFVHFLVFLANVKIVTAYCGSVLPRHEFDFIAGIQSTRGHTVAVAVDKLDAYYFFFVFFLTP